MGWLQVVGAGGVAVALAGVWRWWLYLRFCRWYVQRTEDPNALEQAGTAARAFRGRGN